MAEEPIADLTIKQHNVANKSEDVNKSASAAVSATPTPIPQKPASKTDHPFGEPPVNPLDQKTSNAGSGDSDIIKNIVSTETSEGVDPLLDAAPELDASLLREVAPPKSILLLIFKILFGFLISVGIVSFLFFSSQLTDWFDFATNSFNIPNISKDLSASNAEIIVLQTELNFYNYLQAKAYLDKFSYYGDSYIQYYEIANSQTADNAEKRDALSEMASLVPDLKNSFQTSNKFLVKPFTAQLVDPTFTNDVQLKTLFEESLIEELQKHYEGLGESGDEKVLIEYKNYLHTQKLVGNTEIKDLMLATDFDNLSEDEIYQLIKDVNSLIVNDLSIIQTIKDARIKWSDTIKEIELRTIAVDSAYTQSYYDELGGIRYNSYDFDSSGPTITITGETKLFNTTNFTMISNLIDEFNRSEMFKNADTRTFTKNGSLENGYIATLKLSLDLEDGNEEAIELEEVPDFVEDDSNLTR